MEILKLIKSRRTVHSYSKEKVPTHILEAGIEAGIFAPNHKKTWPWKFLIAGPMTRAALGHIAVNLKSQKENLSEPALSAMLSKYEQEGELIIAILRKSDDPVQAREDYASLACALQNMALFFCELNLGTKWSSGKILFQNETFETLKLNPHEFEICGFFWVGHARVEPPFVERPPLKEFIVQLK